MAIDAASTSAVSIALPRRRAVALASALAAAFAVRFGLAWLHETPNYFPDEYLYAALGRSLGALQGATVRGGPAHFPALLQPLLTAPAWQVGSVATGLRLVQAIESALFTLAAIPAYVLARRLGVGSKLALAAAAGALLVPDALYSGFVLAEPVAYPLVLAAVAAGAVSLARPRPRTQILFLVLASLAAFARVQLGVLPLCFAAAAVAVGLAEDDLRRVLREQRLPLAAIGAAGLAAVAGIAVRGLGYYAGASHLHWAPASVGRNLTVLLYAGGWVVIPGAAVGLWVALTAARSRLESAFGWLTVFVSAALLLEAAVWGDIYLVQERYLFYLLPLWLIAFCVQAARGWPQRRTQALLALGLLLVAVRVPLSGWAQPGTDDHSPFLLAVQRLQIATDTATASLVVSTIAAVLAVAAAAAPWRPRLATPLVLGLALAALAAALLAVTSFDRNNGRVVAHRYLPSDRSWVDSTGVGRTTLVTANGNRPTDGEEQMFWNRSVQRVAVLPGGYAPDLLPSTKLRIADDGTLLSHGRPLRGPLLLDGFTSTVVLRDARLVAAGPHDGLWLPQGDGRVQMYVPGRSAQGWLWSRGGIVVWADRPGHLVVRLNGRDVHIGRHHVHGRATLSFSVCVRGRSAVAFTAGLDRFVDGRPVGGRMELPRFVPDPQACAGAHARGHA